jgi:hypothetical protein
MHNSVVRELPLATAAVPTALLLVTGIVALLKALVTCQMMVRCCVVRRCLVAISLSIVSDLQCSAMYTVHDEQALFIGYTLH